MWKVLLPDTAMDYALDSLILLTLRRLRACVDCISGVIAL
jgi:hypothetical protein